MKRRSWMPRMTGLSQGKSTRSRPVMTALTPGKASGLVEVDRLDAGVRMGAAQDLAIQHAGLREVGAEGRPAGDLVDAIGPDGALADPLVVLEPFAVMPHLPFSCALSLSAPAAAKRCLPIPTGPTHSGRTDLYPIRKWAAGNCQRRRTAMPQRRERRRARRAAGCAAFPTRAPQRTATIGSEGATSRIARARRQSSPICSLRASSELNLASGRTKAMNSTSISRP